MMKQGTSKFCHCFVCGKSNADVDFAEQYSFESGMCSPCHIDYQVWSLRQGVDPTTGEKFPEIKEDAQ
jgi:hypothetical protein